MQENKHKVSIGTRQNYSKQDFLDNMQKRGVCKNTSEDVTIQGLRPDLIIFDDPLGDPVVAEQNKILLEFHAKQIYKQMLNTIVFEYVTHDHSGAVSLLHTIARFKHDMFQSYNIEFDIILVPAATIQQLLIDIYAMSENRYNTSREDIMCYEGVNILPYVSMLDLSTKTHIYYLNNKQIKIGVIKLYENKDDDIYI
jgi:ABC-type proline/glycine betaine transport system ATPase subunit